MKKLSRNNKLNCISRFMFLAMLLMCASFAYAQSKVNGVLPIRRVNRLSVQV